MDKGTLLKALSILLILGALILSFFGIVGLLLGGSPGPLVLMGGYLGGAIVLLLLALLLWKHSRN
jgi:hypothetical protein